MNPELQELLDRYATDYSDFSGIRLTGVNQRGHGRNAPLHTAVQAGLAQDVELLIREGADVNMAGEMGLTPLHYAAMEDREEIALLLKKSGARPSARDMDGRTPADWARSLGNKGVSKVL